MSADEFNNKDAANKWFEKADEDRKLAKSAIYTDRLPALGCYHIQQAAEKYLKGNITYYFVEPERTHIIPRLLMAAFAQLDETPPEALIRPANVLSDYASRSRYPGEDFTFEDCDEGIADFNELSEACRDAGLYFPAWEAPYEYLSVWEDKETKESPSLNSLVADCNQAAEAQQEASHEEPER